MVLLSLLNVAGKASEAHIRPSPDTLHNLCPVCRWVISTGGYYFAQSKDCIDGPSAGCLWEGW